MVVSELITGSNRSTWSYLQISHWRHHWMLRVLGTWRFIRGQSSSKWTKRPRYFHCRDHPSSPNRASSTCHADVYTALRKDTFIICNLSKQTFDFWPLAPILTGPISILWIFWYFRWMDVSRGHSRSRILRKFATIICQRRQSNEIVNWRGDMIMPGRRAGRVRSMIPPHRLEFPHDAERRFAVCTIRCLCCHGCVTARTACGAGPL
jgi:hypothetical protein